MRFITITLIVHAPDPRTGEQKSTQERFREVLASASLAEELGYLAFQDRLGAQPVFGTLEDFVERSSALIGSPAQVIEKVHCYHEQFGHSVLHLHADAGGLTGAQHRASLELFQSDIAPVLRREIPDPPWGWGGGPIGDDAVPARAVAVTG